MVNQLVFHLLGLSYLNIDMMNMYTGLLLILISINVYSQGCNCSIDSLFFRLPVTNSSFEEILNHVDSSNEFSKLQSSEILGTNGVDYFFGKNIQYSHNLYKDIIKHHIFAVNKVKDFTINSIFFKDSIQVVSLSFITNSKHQINTQFKKIKKIIPQDYFVNNNRLVIENNVIKNYYYYSDKTILLPCLHIEIKKNLLSEDYLFNIIYYKYHN